MISSMKPQSLQVKSNIISKATDFSATSFVTSTNQSMLSVTALNKQGNAHVKPVSSGFNSLAPNHAWTDLLQITQDSLIKLCNSELKEICIPSWSTWSLFALPPPLTHLLSHKWFLKVMEQLKRFAIALQINHAEGYITTLWHNGLWVLLKFF